MHRQQMKYLAVAAGALIVGLLAAGTSLQAVLPFLLLLACPLMMIFMMRGMGAHGSHGDDGARHNGTADDHNHEHDAVTRR